MVRVCKRNAGYPGKPDACFGPRPRGQRIAVCLSTAELYLVVFEHGRRHLLRARTSPPPALVRVRSPGGVPVVAACMPCLPALPRPVDTKFGGCMDTRCDVQGGGCGGGAVCDGNRGVCGGDGRGRLGVRFLFHRGRGADSSATVGSAKAPVYGGADAALRRLT